MGVEEAVLAEARQGMERSVEGLRHEVAKIRTGRANPALIESVQVDYYGTMTPLRSLAILSAPEPRLLTVQPYDAGAMEAIERAILKADLGLSPLNDGKLLRLPIPELTEERRRGLVKQIKKVGEEHKVGVRGARRDGIAALKAAEQAGELSKDDSRRGQKKVQELTDAHIEQVDRLIAVKEEEIVRI